MKKKINSLFIITILFYLIGCKKDKPNAIQNENQKGIGQLSEQDSMVREDAKRLKDSLRIEDSLRLEREKITYSAFIFPKNKKDSAMAVFLENYNKEERYKILALNRLDDKNKWRADTLIIPNHLEEDFIKFSPYPQYVEALKGVDKIAFFSYHIHAFGIYEHGKLVKWGPTSMGKKSTPTEKGLHYTNWKKELSISTSNSSWKLPWYFNVHNRHGFGWHQYDLPGFHASHSCMRILEEDAKWLYQWADQWRLTNKGMTVEAKGTPVFIFGDTNFKQRPWLSLIDNSLSDDYFYTSEEMSEIITTYIPEILKEQANSKKYRELKEKEKSE